MGHVETDDFLEHYGVKGMKWGQRTGVQSTRKERRAAFKTARKEQAQRNKSFLKSRSGGQKAKAFALDMATFGGYTTHQLARSQGYSRGRSAALSTMGVYGQLALNSAEVNKKVRSQYG